MEHEIIIILLLIVMLLMPWGSSKKNNTKTTQRFNPGKFPVPNRPSKVEKEIKYERKKQENN